jgi:hypothetical protein
MGFTNLLRTGESVGSLAKWGDRSGLTLGWLSEPALHSF